VLIIKSAQIAALNAAALDSFRRRMVDHLTAVFPDRVAAMGTDRVLAAVDDGIRQAAGYRITAERDVARFIDLVVELAPDFPDRPATAWTRAVLDDSLTPPSVRLDRLYHRLQAEYPNATHLWRAWP
jgi:hypothetical protein